MADSFRRNLTYDEAPKGTKNEDWVPGETEEAIRAAIARVNGGDMGERIRRRKLEGVLAQFFDATRGTSSYEMYRAHLEQTANEVTDLFAALGDAPLEDVRREFRRIDREQGRAKAAYFAYGAAKALNTTVHNVLQLSVDEAITIEVANAKDGER